MCFNALMGKDFQKNALVGKSLNGKGWGKMAAS